ncbi:hypothetical protein PV433_27895 [Paenibacillus sp. GYB004]|uniref:hypothetical protein n=1 Tax=Paenibacillus sp. GYB004 TaxID=2994393 RepID=UPI002F9679F7
MYSKLFDFVQAGEVTFEGFEVEIGEMNYGMEIDGIIGFDYIQSAGLVIDSKAMTVNARE